MTADYGLDLPRLTALCHDLQRARSAGDGREAARLEAEVLHGSERMVRKFTRHFLRCFKLPGDDIAQEVRIGVLLAARTFDESQASFPVYAFNAALWRVQELQELMPPLPQGNGRNGYLLAKQLANAIPPPLEVGPVLGHLAVKERRVIELLYGLHGRPARTVDEIAEETGMGRATVYRRYEAALKRIRKQFVIPFDG